MADAPKLHGLFIGNRSHLHGAGRYYGMIEGEIEKLGIRLYHIRPNSYRSAARLLVRALLRQDPPRIDFVLFNALGSIFFIKSLVISWISGLFRIPVFMYWRELSISFSLYKEKAPRKIQTADRFAMQPHLKHIANSNVCAAYIKQRYQIPSPIVVGNCARTLLPNNYMEQICSSHPSVVCIGSIQNRKGTDLFIETAIRVCQIHMTVEFIWIGSNTPTAEDREKIERANLQHRILFYGEMEKPAYILAKATVFFCSSREESFSQATAEAMALGKTIVTFESGGPPEILAGTGYVIPNFDTMLAAQKILTLINASAPIMVNVAARKRYEELYSPVKHAAMLNAHIRACLTT
jgi:glycosyltransferase involved in cell wall biosynthesis